MTPEEKEKIIKEREGYVPATPEEVDKERTDILTSEQKTIIACKKIVEKCIREEAFKKNRESYDANIVGAALQVIEMDIQKDFKRLFNGEELKNIIK